MDWDKEGRIRLEAFFREKWYVLGDNQEEWNKYLEEHGVTVMNVSNAAELYNSPNASMSVCIRNPEIMESLVAPEDFDDIWYLVPKDFAERVLALGGLP